MEAYSERVRMVKEADAALFFDRVVPTLAVSRNWLALALKTGPITPPLRRLFLEEMLLVEAVHQMALRNKLPFKVWEIAVGIIDSVFGQAHVRLDCVSLLVTTALLVAFKVG